MEPIRVYDRSMTEPRQQTRRYRAATTLLGNLPFLVSVRMAWGRRRCIQCTFACSVDMPPTPCTPTLAFLALLTFDQVPWLTPSPSPCLSLVVKLHLAGSPPIPLCAGLILIKNFSFSGGEDWIIWGFALEKGKLKGYYTYEVKIFL